MNLITQYGPYLLVLALALVLYYSNWILVCAICPFVCHFKSG